MKTFKEYTESCCEECFDDFEHEFDNINLDQFIFDPDSFFYDVIYNPKETNFLKNAKSKGFLVQNGLMMFVYQAAEAFKTWHNIEPKIDKNLIEACALFVLAMFPTSHITGLDKFLQKD